MCVGVRQRHVGMCVCQVDRGRQQTCQGGGAKGGTEPESGLSNWILVIKKKNNKNKAQVCLRVHLVCVPARVLFKGRDLIGFVCFACGEVPARSKLQRKDLPQRISHQGNSGRRRVSGEDTAWGERNRCTPVFGKQREVSFKVCPPSHPRSGPLNTVNSWSYSCDTAHSKPCGARLLQFASKLTLVLWVITHLNLNTETCIHGLIRCDLHFLVSAQNDTGCNAQIMIPKSWRHSDITLALYSSQATVASWSSWLTF